MQLEKKKCRNYSFFAIIDFALVTPKLLARTYKLVPAAESKHLSLSFLTFFSFTVAITSVLWKLHHQCTVTRRRSIDCVQLAVHKRKVPNPTNPLLWYIARRSKKNRLFRCVRCFAPLWRRAIEFLFPQYFLKKSASDTSDRESGSWSSRTYVFIGAMNLRSNPPLLDSWCCCPDSVFRRGGRTCSILGKRFFCTVLASGQKREYTRGQFSHKLRWKNKSLPRSGRGKFSQTLNSLHPMPPPPFLEREGENFVTRALFSQIVTVNKFQTFPFPPPPANARGSGRIWSRVSGIQVLCANVHTVCAYYLMALRQRRCRWLCTYRICGDNECARATILRNERGKKPATWDEFHKTYTITLFNGIYIFTFYTFTCLHVYISTFLHYNVKNGTTM